jgi:hypothetical protein
MIRPVLPYGHLGFIAGIIAAGVGEVVADPLAHLAEIRRAEDQVSCADVLLQPAELAGA